MANTTKRALAAALKDLLAHKPLDKITIQDLVDTAEVSRKTFYYHFSDIYALLEWTLVDEGHRLLGERLTPDTWQQGLERVVDYLEQNRVVILNIHRSKDNVLLDLHLTQLVRPLFEDVFNAQEGHERIPEEDRQFILDLYAAGVVSLFLFWVHNGMKPEARSILERVDRLFDGSMESLIQRYLAHDSSEARHVNNTEATSI